tara:strand:- start:40 stop:369 length:330 start_codon:yes stop_codon:yes gene_type:complete
VASRGGRAYPDDVFSGESAAELKAVGGVSLIESSTGVGSDDDEDDDDEDEDEDEDDDDEANAEGGTRIDSSPLWLLRRVLSAIDRGGRRDDSGRGGRAANSVACALILR